VLVLTLTYVKFVKKKKKKKREEKKEGTLIVGISIIVIVGVSRNIILFYKLNDTYK
jgi:hypothetical protein